MPRARSGRHHQRCKPVLSHRALDAAHQWAALDNAGDARGGHGSFCTQTYVESQRAHCWTALGKPHRAVQVYDDSDLDLLIELTPGASIIDIIDLDEEISAVLGCPVDVVTTTELESNDLLRRGVNRHLRPLTVAA